jgi:GNAT superfamily N-acetyltransferase
MSIVTERLTGSAMIAALPTLARLRISVFRDWPYLYEGSLAYEENYLRDFAASDGAMIVAARDGDAIVGAATGAPMEHHAREFGAPFQDAGYDISRIFYFGESVLSASHRGRGLGHTFFDAREAYARSLGGMMQTAFCGVVRPVDHPLRPADYSPLDPFWVKRGYTKLDGMIASFTWTDIGATTKTAKPMQFWMRALP